VEAGPPANLCAKHTKFKYWGPRKKPRQQYRTCIGLDFRGVSGCAARCREGKTLQASDTIQNFSFILMHRLIYEAWINKSIVGIHEILKTSAEMGQIPGAVLWEFWACTTVSMDR
jgi:hypothetical protein